MMEDTIISACCTKQEICGNINVPCGESVTIFNTDGSIFPSGSISIFYDSGCSSQLQVNITDSNHVTHSFFVLPGNTRAQSISNVASITITCIQDVGSNSCRGKYCFSLYDCEHTKTSLQCFCVPKVYDWVINTISNTQEVTIPEDCLRLIEKAVSEGKNITIDCTPPCVPPLFPISCSHPNPVSGIACEVVSIRPHKMFNTQKAVVKFFTHITITISVFADKINICCFTATIKIINSMLLCLPKPLSKDNIMCRLTSIECHSDLIPCSDKLFVDLNACQEIQVQADVKVKVPAMFCQPNAPTPIPPDNNCFI